MRTAVSILLIACNGPCPNEPLSPLERTPRIAVVMTNGIPDDEPDVLDAFAAIALYDEDDAVIHERWIDSRTVWDEASGRFDATSVVPDEQIPGELHLARGSNVAAFSVPDGEVLMDLDVGAHVIDLAPIEGGIAASREDGHVVLVIDGAIAMDVDAGASGRVAAVGSNVAVGTDEGAIALVALDGTVSRVELPGLDGCREVAPLEGRVAVLCADTGLALIDGAEITVRAGALGSDSLVALSGTWVAAVSRGPGGPDVLIAADIAGDGMFELATEAWSMLEGPALGEGAFADGVLSWPSTSRGVRRFGFAGDRFLPESDLALPACYHFPARRVRALP